MRRTQWAYWMTEPASRGEGKNGRASTQPPPKATCRTAQAQTDGLSLTACMPHAAITVMATEARKAGM
jgi:hypothetical protein